MVMDYSDTHVVGATAQALSTATPSFKRWLKHSFFWQRTSRYFSKADEQAIAAAVQQAELRHHAEIRVVIEAHLPSHLAYLHDCRSRAMQLFASLAVWDTEHNTGILLYVNLCAHQVELLADRGIHAQVDAACWTAVCTAVIAAFKQGCFKQGVLDGLAHLSDTLNHSMARQALTDNGNEMSNQPLLFD